MLVEVAFVADVVLVCVAVAFAAVVLLALAAAAEDCCVVAGVVVSVALYVVVVSEFQLNLCLFVQKVSKAILKFHQQICIHITDHID